MLQNFTTLPAPDDGRTGCTAETGDDSSGALLYNPTHRRGGSRGDGSSKGMRDADVRSALHRKVLREHHGQPDTLVLDELGLWYGTARVDIAVINGKIHGYEIKSDRDTLERLPDQARIYSNVLDRVTLVVGQTHAAKAAEIIPPWWGIKVAQPGPRGAVHFHEDRAPIMNPAIDPVAVAALLWCNELIEILAERNAARGLRGKSRDRLTRRLAEILPLEELRAVVRERLKRRTDWRVGGAQT
jgi:hypothetical protein